MKFSATARCIAALAIFFAILPCPAAAQRPGPTTQPSQPSSADVLGGTSDLAVTLRGPKNEVINAAAKVTLRNSAGQLRGTSITEKGRVIFRALPLDTYQISVELQGYPTAQASVSLELSGKNRNLDVLMGAGKASTEPLPPPPLSTKEQKELTAGLRALQAQRIDEARKHFLSAAKSNPNQPDIDYLLGIVSVISGDVVTAKQYFENAANRYQYVRALVALGELDLQEGNLPQAKDYLEKALKSEPNNWRAEQLLAAVELRLKSFTAAIQHAERALQSGNTDANGARLTLAAALSASGDLHRSNQVLSELLKKAPSPEQAKQANALLESNRRVAAPTSAVSGVASPSSAEPRSNSVEVDSLPLSPSLPPPSDNPLTDRSRWAPPNVDDAVPPANTSVACPMPKLLDAAGRRVLELVENLDRFTATEHLHHESLNEFGLAVRTNELKFEYTVYIHEVKPGIFDVSEYRDGSDSRDIFPEHVATLGTVALAFVFHPEYSTDFDFRCEGLTHQAGQLAWQIHFQQKSGAPSRLRSYRLGTKYYRVSIKGRAWIAADSFEIIRMQSDLVKPVPDLRLRAEHQDIAYGPVPFKKRDLILWLPYSAETYLDFNGHRIHRRQDFSEYLLFWVDEHQRVEKPKEITEEQPGAPSG
ncbi:MAG TPA: tetratricopeptide repeat protein [Candidatus Eisenbacteria bacterium]|nr:tetratricopeptide repeat protein [Candidatus Eisenbacteria bacterium]